MGAKLGPTRGQSAKTVLETWGVKRTVIRLGPFTIDWFTLAFGVLAIVAGSVMGLLVSNIGNPLYLAALIVGPCIIWGAVTRVRLALLVLIFSTTSREFLK